MTPKEIFEIAKHLSPADQAVWLHINRDEPYLLSSKEFIEWAMANAGPKLDFGMGEYHALPQEEQERWKDAVMARAYRLGLEHVRDLWRSAEGLPTTKKKSYTVTLPVHTVAVLQVHAHNPTDAVTEALKLYDPNNPKHLPRYTDEMAFSVERSGAKVEED